MFQFFSNKMTELSDHYLDWSRVAILARSGNHVYSRDELMMRGRIAGATLASAFLGAYLNDSEYTYCGNLTMAIMTGAVGLAAAHLYESPSFHKRLWLSRECDSLKTDIAKQVGSLCSESGCFENLQEKVEQVVSAIMQISLSEGANGNATQTWGRRRFLLTKARENLDKTADEVRAFWLEGDVEEVLDKLDDRAIEDRRRFQLR